MILERFVNYFEQHGLIRARTAAEPIISSSQKVISMETMKYESVIVEFSKSMQLVEVPATNLEIGIYLTHDDQIIDVAMGKWNTPLIPYSYPPCSSLFLQN